MKINKYKKPSFYERVGATLSGVKPSELLKVDTNECEMIEKSLFNNKVEVITVKDCGDKKQVFAYHVESIKETLSKDDVKSFLFNLGYPEYARPEEYISHIINRLRGFMFPHEVGVFLGYPLKDVKGYMGLNSLPHTKTLGWRMYGDTKESESLRKSYCFARKKAIQNLNKLLGNSQVINI